MQSWPKKYSFVLLIVAQYNVCYIVKSDNISLQSNKLRESFYILVFLNCLFNFQMDDQRLIR